MNKKTISFLVLFVALSLGLAGTVSAHGIFGCGGNLDPETIVSNQSQMFAHQAEILGISVDQVKQYWAEGKNMPEIAEELGVDLEDLQIKMKAGREEQMRERLQVLVDNGVITQEQADLRLQHMQDRMPHDGFGRGHGMGHGPADGTRPMPNNQNQNQ